ncbi:MAG: ATP-dependent DNA helicase RecQ, partial [Spirochaetales bacterium]|nr:ATP-dependent DNA helicase RecQ [Spirochaetales bacterium]
PPVSDWGASFRPSYLKLPEIRQAVKILQVTAFTATASEYVLKRIQEIVFKDSNPNLVQAMPDGPNISYSVHPALSKDNEIRAQVETAKRPAIIFCRSRTVTELTARMLRRQLGDDEIRFYHAGLEREEKTAVEEWFFESNNGILTATCAYGIG